MPKYEVELSRTQTHSAVIEVEADDEDSARMTAEKIAEEDLSSENPAVEWLLEDDTLEVEDVNEADEDKA
jgi:hypothetical protein